MLLKSLLTPPCAERVKPTMYNGGDVTPQDPRDQDELAQLRALFADSPNMLSPEEEEESLRQYNGGEPLDCDRRIEASQLASLDGNTPETDAVCGDRSRVWVCDDGVSVVVESSHVSRSSRSAYVDLNETDVTFFAARTDGQITPTDISQTLSFIMNPELSPLIFSVRQTELCLINVGVRSVWIDSENQVLAATNGFFDGEGEKHVIRRIPPPPPGVAEKATNAVMQRSFFSKPAAPDEPVSMLKMNKKNFCDSVFFVTTKLDIGRPISTVQLDYRPLYEKKGVNGFCSSNKLYW